LELLATSAHGFKEVTQQKPGCNRPKPEMLKKAHIDAVERIIQALVIVAALDEPNHFAPEPATSDAPVV